MDNTSVVDQNVNATVDLPGGLSHRRAVILARQISHNKAGRATFRRDSVC
jgi:hypothetical protein